MSFVSQFHPFLGVRVEEDPSAQILSGFRLVPTEDCRKVLNNRAIVFRPRESGFQLFYETNPLAADPLLGPITSREQFSFALTSDRADLFELYEPDLTAATGPQLYLDNLTPSGNIQTKTTLTVSTVVATGDAVRIAPPVFESTVDVSGGSPPTQLTVKEKFPPNSVVLQAAIPPSAGGRSAVKVDLSDESPGLFTLETNAAGSPVTTVYVADELAGTGVLGVVDLFWESRQDTVAAGGIAYSIRLRKR